MPKKGLPDFKQEEKALKKLFSELPEVVGQTAVTHAQDNFDREGFSDNGKVDKWAPRKDQKRNKGRKLLVQTGRLKGSIDYEVNGSEVGISADAEVGGFKYGHRHNQGDEGVEQRKFADYSSDIENEIEQHLENELDKIFE